MIQTVERSLGHFVNEAKAQNVLSELVIPAVPGEFYSYSSRFTKDRSLYMFLKCKSNKARTLASAIELGRESNLVFLFGKNPHVCSVKMAHFSGLLGNPINGESFGETWIAATGITTKDFYELRSRKDVKTLVEACCGACSTHKTLIALESGVVIAMMTDAGKYGMFVVRELTSISIDIDAWHILL